MMAFQRTYLVTFVTLLCTNSPRFIPYTLAYIQWTPSTRGRVSWGDSGACFLDKSDSGNSGLQITESAFPGAGVPRPELTPEEIAPLLMEALEYNDFPTVDAGLLSMWAFSGDTTRYIFGNNQTEFIDSAHETASTWPTSFYGSAIKGKEWSIETPINRVGGDSGWIATQVMRTVSSDGRLRRWQWELRKHRRPPKRGCWYVETIGSSDRKGQFEAE